LSIFFTLLLVFVLLVRPQEFIPQLQSLSLLNVTTGMAGLGILVELAMRKQKSAWSPQLPWLAAFLGWCLLCTVRRVGVRDGWTSTFESVGLSTIFMLVITYSARSFARYRAIAVLLIAISAAISLVCVHQSQQELQCIVLGGTPNSPDKSEGEPDGRACDTAWVCEKDGKEGASYECEKAGLFGTFTEGQRVRWRGTLGDPNELAVAVGAVLPFVFALQSLSKKKWFTPFMLGLLGLGLYCVVLTGSRGGQLVILTVFGVYFVRRYGAKGLIIGVILGLPVLLFGGRSGEEADSSSQERIDLLYEGMDLIKQYPVTGVGVGQFVEYSFNQLTAHNSYVLAAAELGLPGSMLWLILVYVSVKIPFVIARRPPAGCDPRVIPFAYALVVSFAGILVGIFFLSFCYKQLLFIFFGLSGALFGIVKNGHPSFNVPLSRKEILYLGVLDVAMLVFVFVYSRVMNVA
jgi:O-antigen ligase/polysaccharide polymerase Wzy-like membrane protein